MEKTDAINVTFVVAVMVVLVASFIYVNFFEEDEEEAEDEESTEAFVDAGIEDIGPAEAEAPESCAAVPVVANVTPAPSLC